MKSKIAIVFILVLLMTMLVTGCSSYEEEKEEPQAMIPLEKLWFADDLRFEYRIVIDGEIFHAFWRVFVHINPNTPYFNPFYTELVFVHNEEEATGFPDNIIVAWPREGEFSQGLIDGMHWAVNRDANSLTRRSGSKIRKVITLEEFGLSYPLTVEDLVDNWEKIYALWNAFTPSEQNTVRWVARGGQDEPPASKIPYDELLEEDQ